MIVLVLTKAPDGLRGHATRWLTEIAAGVYVGRVPKRVRENLWSTVLEMLGRGRAMMVYSSRSEQGYDFIVAGHDWTPVDLDGLTLMLRPGPSAAPLRRPSHSVSNARRYRQARKFSG
ncbi:type I-E CRISPR-associated endoribonuclease Cas2 [Micrococcales bacterium 31B]|nr:type I-E CRISPR-associated endoribonuclease Cas2 [Micrococcales bacterium 31B]